MNRKLINDKQELRSRMRNCKKLYQEVDLKLKSEKLQSLLESSELWKESLKVLCYWNLFDEVYTQSLINKWWQEKEIYLPKVIGENLEFARFMGEESLNVDTRYGIAEPVNTPILIGTDVDLVIVPGMAFDRFGGRLGRGKGFYDRFLKEYNGVTIGVCFDFQIVDQVPMEQHDRNMDFVLSEKGWIVK